MSDNGKIFTRRFVYQTTTSGSASGVWTIAQTNNTLWSVSMVCIARDQAGTHRAMYRRHGLIYRQGGGNCTIQGSIETVGTDIETSATLDATLGVSGTSIGSSVVGLAATTIDWSFMLTILEASAP
jgi:hypothetical protein